MTDEKRRFFRINEHIGLSYDRIDQQEPQKISPTMADIEALIASQDECIEQLLGEVAGQSPKMAELMRALNQKLDRVVQQLVLESQMTAQLATRFREVNISACGIGFWSDQDAPPGTHLRLELELSSGIKKISSKGILVASEQTPQGYYWRVNFYGMSLANQELLIQHIVQRQSAQLKQLRGS